MQLAINTKYTFFGVAFGLAFPLMAWTLDIISSGLTLSPDIIIWIHQNNRLHYIIDLAPPILGWAFFTLGKVLQRERNQKIKLREYSEKTCLVLNSTGEAIYGIDLNGKCTFTNKVCLQMLGYQSEQELLGKNMHQLIHHTRKDGTPYPVEECKIFKAFQIGVPSHVYDEVLWRADGSSFDSEYRSFPMTRHGEVIGSVVSFTNITARIAQEEKERQNSNTLIRLKDAMARIVKLGGTTEEAISLELAQQRILKIIALTLDVERVSAWYYDDEQSSIIADSLYRKAEDAYESGLTLSATDYPNYFVSLADEIIIVVTDAVADPRTCEFKGNYLKPLGITSMMDVPIKVQGKTIGVICNEHVGEVRQWSLLEQEFVTSASISLALLLESHAHRKSEARQHAVTNTMVDGLITIDEDGLIESFNPAAEKMFGYSSEEIIGVNVEQLMPVSYRNQHRNGLKHYNETGKANILGVTGVEVEGLRKDKSSLPIAISISKMHIGGKRLFSGVIRDISEWKVLERERERIAAELTQLIDTANAPIFGIDTQGKINEWNQAAVEIIGYCKAEVLGQKLVKNFIIDEFKASVKAVLDRALKGEKTSNYELPLYTKGGKRRDILLNATPRRDLNNNITGVIGIGQDITNLREKEKALNQAQKMEAVGQLTGGIAHDFNNLLSIIGGNLRFLQQDVGEVGAQIQESFEDAISAVDDGSALTKRLLGFSRTHAMVTQTIDIKEVVIKFTRFLSRTLGEHVVLDINQSDETLYIKVDPAQFENALLNLAINARDAMPNGGELSVSIERRYLDLDEINDNKSGDYVVISVTDTGEGIKAEDLAHVYEPFFTSKEVGKGSGLGLSMVYGFAKQSGGVCHISSILGEGTTVSMFFPEEKEAALSNKDTVKKSSLLGGNDIILVVEDETRVRRVAVRDLKSLGYKVLEAENADVAMKVLEKEAVIDLLFTDILMPGKMDGRGLAAWTMEHYPQIKILLTSGYSKDKSSSITNEAQQRLPMLRKPYSIDKLTMQIRAMLTEESKDRE